MSRICRWAGRWFGSSPTAGSRSLVGGGGADRAEVPGGGAHLRRHRCEIFPPDLDPTADYYTRVLRFTLERDERHTDSPYVALRRGEVLLGRQP